MSLAPPPDRNPRSHRGFTLIELMLVIVLIGIVSATIIPEMRGTFGDALLRSTSRDLVAAFSLASSRAVSLGQIHRVRLDFIQGKYSIERSSRESSHGNEFTQVKDVPGAEGDLDHRIVIEIRHASQDPAASPGPGGGSDADPGDHNDGVLFYPDGTAQAADVELTDREGFRIGLRISPVTARVHILDLARR